MVKAMADETGAAATYAQRVGERLRAMRKQKRLSLQAVEASSTHEFKASVLGAYERGERAISVPRLQRLAAFYSVPVDQLLPREVSAEAAAWAEADDVIDLSGSDEGERRPERPRMVDDRVSIDLTKLEHLDSPERDLLSRYLFTIQVQRQDFNGRQLTIRHEDMRALAIIFDTTAESMRRRLSDLGLRLPTQ